MPSGAALAFPWLLSRARSTRTHAQGTNANVGYICWMTKDAAATCDPSGAGCGGGGGGEGSDGGEGGDESDSSAQLGLGFASVLAFLGAALL